MVVRQGPHLTGAFDGVGMLAVVERAVKLGGPSSSNCLTVGRSSGSSVMSSRRRHRTVRLLATRCLDTSRIDIVYRHLQHTQPIFRLFRVLYTICCNPPPRIIPWRPDSCALRTLPSTLPPPLFLPHPYILHLLHTSCDLRHPLLYTSPKLELNNLESHTLSAS